MQKCLIFLAVLFSTSVWAGSLDWNPYVMTHERFVHLSSEDKEQVIIKTMEMIVEMEGKYKKAVVHNQPSSEQLEKYVLLLKKLQSLLISEAYAGVDEKFIARAKKFNDLRVSLGDNACIYGGYISKLVDGRCVSPGMISKTSKSKNDIAIRAAYFTAANENANKSGKCEGPTKISCNPVIFGFKKVADNVPFCVNTSPSEAHNAAFECMKEALSDKKSNLTDSKDTRLGNLKAALGDSTASVEFDKAHRFLFRTCMCDDNQGLNSAYVKYMKPHRTCFGMLNTLSAIDSKECSALKSQTSLDAFGEKWKDYYGSTSFKKEAATREVEFDSVYKGILAKPEMQQLCGAQTPPAGGDEEDTEGNECSTDCKKETVDGKEVVYCTVSTITSKKKVDGKIVTTVVKDFKKVKLLLEAGKTKLTYEAKEGGATYECDVEAPKSDETLSCKLSANYDADPKKPIITLTFENLKEGQKPVVSWAGEGTVDKNDDKIFNATATDEAKELIATFTVEGAATPDTKKTDNADPKKTEDKKDDKKDDKKNDKKTDGEAAPATTATAAAGPNSCPITIQIPKKDDDDAGYDISTSLAPYQPADVTVKVLAVVKLPEGKTMPADYEIVWIRKGYKGPKAAEVKPPTLNVEQDSNAEASTTSNTTTTTTTTTEVPFAQGGPGNKEANVDETRMTEVYSTCAQLLNSAKKSIKESCQVIPVLEAPKPPVNYGPARQPPMFMTPSYNTRTMGIQ